MKTIDIMLCGVTGAPFWKENIAVSKKFTSAPQTKLHTLPLLEWRQKSQRRISKNLSK